MRRCSAEPFAVRARRSRDSEKYDAVEAPYVAQSLYMWSVASGVSDLPHVVLALTSTVEDSSFVAWGPNPATFILLWWLYSLLQRLDHLVGPWVSLSLTCSLRACVWCDCYSRVISLLVVGITFILLSTSWICATCATRAHTSAFRRTRQIPERSELLQFKFFDELPRMRSLADLE